jgi:hypothetical protein
MNKAYSNMSPARRRAEMILNQSQKRQESFRHEQRLAHDAMIEKTARLRALRLAKEAADKDTAASSAPTTALQPPKARHSKQT